MFASSIPQKASPAPVKSAPAAAAAVGAPAEASAEAPAEAPAAVEEKEEETAGAASDEDMSPPELTMHNRPAGTMKSQESYVK